MFTLPAACFPAVLSTPISLEVGSYNLGYDLHSPPALWASHIRAAGSSQVVVPGRSHQNHLGTC